jgi:hypothetical protein
VETRVGTGPDDYRSVGLEATVGPDESPWQTIFDYAHSKSIDYKADEIGAGLSWVQSDMTTWNMRLSHIEDDQFRIEGIDAGVALRLERLWNGTRESRLDLGLGYSEYNVLTRRPLPAALAARQPEQDRYSVGLTQGLTPTVSLNATHVGYDYNTDPGALALFFLRRLRVPLTNASIFLSFPDATDTIGIAWNPDPKIAFNLSYSKTETVIDQALESTALETTYFPSQKYRVGLIVTRSTAQTIAGPAGTVLIPETEGTFFELILAVAF